MESRSRIPLLTRSFLVIAFAVLSVSSSDAQVYMTKDEALRRAFPNATRIDRKTLFLTDQQVKAVELSARTKVESKVVTYYVGLNGSAVLGHAFLETHVVRTMPETFLLVVTPDGLVQTVEILAFYEPEDYLPSKRWLALFRSKVLNDDLWVKRGIQAISGATLSANAITSGVRRLLAIHQLIVPKETEQ